MIDNKLFEIYKTYRKGMEAQNNLVPYDWTSEELMWFFIETAWEENTNTAQAVADLTLSDWVELDALYNKSSL